jgi:hypothetical protein
LIIALVAASTAAPGVSSQELLVRRGVNADVIGEPHVPTRSEIIENYFDRGVFGGASPQAVAAMLEQTAILKVDLGSRDYRLSRADRLKLKAAAAGDIKRYLDLVWERRLELVQATHLTERALTTAAIESSNTLREEMNVVLGSRSLFSKTWRRIESLHENDDRATVRASRYRQTVEYVINGLQKQLGLSGDQRQKLIAIVMAETRPLKRYADRDSYAVLAQMASMPDRAIAAILDTTQLGKLKELFAFAKAQWSNLVDEGYLDTELTGEEETEIRGKLPSLNQMQPRPAKVQP